MKELKVYAVFFKSHLVIFIFSLLFGSLAGFVLYTRQSVVYSTEQVYELVDENKSADEKISVAEEVVGLLREGAVVDPDVQNLYISRISPFAVKVILRSDIPQTNSENLKYISRFLNERGSFQLVGTEVVSVQKPTLFLFLFGGLVVGLGVGLGITLIKTYLRTY